MAKMYYTDQEAARKLGIPVADLAKMVSEGKLRVYVDGAKKMFKAEEVDALSAKGGAGEVELTPADSGTRDAVTLSDSGAERPPGKEDTVITSEGISIFDEEDLEIETADPMAKTSIAPSVEDQVSLEGVGSGSGLLDLTRESDDTSLGAEVLEHIDVEGAVPSGSGVAGALEAPTVPESEAVVTEPVLVSEEADPGAALFGGLAGGACLTMLVLAGASIAAVMDTLPPYLRAIGQNVPIFLVAAALTAIILGAAGHFVGKSTARRAAALQRSA